MVGERGFEPPAPASRRQCSTRLSYSPTGTGWRTIRCRSEGLLAGGAGVSKRARRAWSVAEHFEPVGVADEFFARRIGTRGGGLGGLDRPPVVEAGRRGPRARRATRRARPRPPCRQRRLPAAPRRSVRRLHSRRGGWCRSSPTARAAPSRRNTARRRSPRRHWRTSRRARHRARRRCAGSDSRCS